VFESGTRPDVFMICETWTGEEALAAHMKTEHFKRYVAVLEEQGSLKLEKFDFPA
jgi:quinol monooxygenase YgiN